MTLNKQKGNMYSFVTHTWNPIKGKCPHDCSYCYMKRFPQGELRFDEKCMKDDLGQGNYIFVGSSCDMFANDVQVGWIRRVLSLCSCFVNNTYLFQTKNPKAFDRFKGLFPPNSIFGTTIETNREDELEKAPSKGTRLSWMVDVPRPRMVSIEPIMDFDLSEMKRWMFAIKPKFVSIGADSKGHNLPEPSWDKVQELIKELKKFTEVKVKDNLKRLM